MRGWATLAVGRLWEIGDVSLQIFHKPFVFLLGALSFEPNNTLEAKFEKSSL